MASWAKRAHLRERRAVVDAQHQPLVGHGVRGDRAAVGADQIERLGQIQLALRVLGAQPRQRLAQGAGREHVDAGVDLANLQLLGRGVAVGLGLHDGLDGAVGVAHHASIAARIVQEGARHRRARAAGLVRVHELGDRLGAHERNVAAEDDHRGVRVSRVERREARHHRAAGPVRLGLHREPHSLRQDARQCTLGRIDDDDPPGAGGERGAHGPQHHRDATQLVQHLGRARTHPRAPARGKDHDRRSRSHAMDGRSWACEARSSACVTRFRMTDAGWVACLLKRLMEWPCR